MCASHAVATLLLALAITSTATAMGACQRQDAAGQCRLTCRVAEERPANFTIAIVGSVLNLDLDTIGWRFEVVNQTGTRTYDLTLDSATGALVLPKPVDYDRTPVPTVIELVVRGTPIATSRPQQPVPAVGVGTTCAVEVEIVDTNDNLPRLDDSRFRRSVTIREDAPIGSVLATLPVVDGDSGFFGEWEIARIANGTGLDVSVRDPDFRGIGTFVLDNRTGAITLIAELDAERRQRYEIAFTILPLDRSPGVNFGSNTMQVFVEDVDEFYPNIEISPLVLGNITAVPVKHTAVEGLSVPQLLFQATTTDKDVDSDINFTVEDGLGDFYVQNTIPGGWFLFAREELDREKVNRYNLTLVARNTNANYTKSTSTNFTVFVTDVDDNSPTFSQAEYRIYLNETLSASSPVAQFVAFDPDLGDGVSYEISNTLVSNGSMTPLSPDALALNASVVFSLNATTGLLSLERQLDFEQLGAVVFNLTLLATSSRDPNKTNTSQALIHLVDVNDEAPVFSQPHYVFHVAESGGAQELVGHLNASDDDAGRNGRVFYSLRDTDSPDESQDFLVNVNTGMIVTVGEFDREQKAEYSFLAVATDDAAVRRLTGVARVTVLITDIDDNAPVITAPPPEILIARNTAAGATLWEFDTSDADATATELTFTIMPQKDSQRSTIESHFRITSGGRLEARRSLTTLPAGTYTVFITVAEASMPRLSSTVTIHLNITEPPASNTLQSGSSISLTVVIIAIAGGALLLIAVAVLGVCIHLRRKQRRMASASSKPSSGGLVFQNNLYLDSSSITKESRGPRPESLALGSLDKTGSYLASSDTQSVLRSDPEGSAFTPGSFTEAPFSDKTRNRVGIYEAHSGTERTPTSRDSCHDWERRMSVRTSTSFVEDAGSRSSSSSVGPLPAVGLATIEPSPDADHGRHHTYLTAQDGLPVSNFYTTVGPSSLPPQAPALVASSPRHAPPGRRRVQSESADPPQAHVHAELSAQRSYSRSPRTTDAPRSPRTGQPRRSPHTGQPPRSALSNQSDRRSPRSATTSRSHSLRYSTSPPSSAQAIDCSSQAGWQPVCYKAPIASPAIPSPLVTDLAPSASGYKASPVRQFFPQTAIPDDQETDDTDPSSEEADTEDEMRYYPAGFRPQRNVPPAAGRAQLAHVMQNAAAPYHQAAGPPKHIVEVRESEPL